MNSITLSVEEPSSVAFDVSTADELAFGFDGITVVYQALPEYEGPVVITPSSETQVLSTTNTHERKEEP